MKRAVVFAHYDPHGRLDDYVRASLREYRRIADVLVLVSTGLQEVPRDAGGLVDVFIARDNIGYDFCSWRAGIESISGIESLDELICVNDSVYGPVRELGPVLSDPRVAEADAWGMCLSLQGTGSTRCRPSPHLQSWFVAMRRSVLRSTAFRSFWSGVVPVPCKQDVIERYEIGMSASLLRAGFRIAAIHDASLSPRLSWEEVRAMASIRRPLPMLRLAHRLCRDGGRVNPSILRPLRLLRDGVPYFKSSIFRLNHLGIDLDALVREVGKRTEYDMDMVLRHQKRLGSIASGRSWSDGAVA